MEFKCNWLAGEKKLGVWDFSIGWGLGLWDGVWGLGWGFKHVSDFKKSRYLILTSINIIKKGRRKSTGMWHDVSLLSEMKS